MEATYDKLSKNGSKIVPNQVDVPYFPISAQVYAIKSTPKHYYVFVYTLSGF